MGQFGALLDSYYCLMGTYKQRPCAFHHCAGENTQARVQNSPSHCCACSRQCLDASLVPRFVFCCLVHVSSRDFFLVSACSFRAAAFLCVRRGLMRNTLPLGLKDS